jgi:hypothetical protein
MKVKTNVKAGRVWTPFGKAAIDTPWFTFRE